MDKKICEILSDILIYDDRFSSNMHSLEMLNANYNSGDPVEIWMEAMSITNEMAKIEKGRFDIFSNIGKDWSDAKRYAVKKMVIYILDFPTSNISSTDKEEMRMIRKELNNLYSHSFQNDIEISSGNFAAETVQLNRIDKVQLRKSIDSIINISNFFSHSDISSFMDFVMKYNDSLGGYLNNETYKLFDLLKQKMDHKKEIEGLTDYYDDIFNSEQCISSKIKIQPGLWLKSMYAMLNGDYGNGKDVEIEDYCAGFLAALKSNYEYCYKGGYDDFFKMMRDLFNIDVSENNQLKIIHWIQDNDWDFKKWEDNRKMRKRRREIAEDLVKMKEEYSKKLVEEYKLKNQ